MDAAEHATMEIAELLLWHWIDPLGDVSPYGSIVVIDRLWVAQRFATAGQWAGVVHGILAKEYRRRSLLLLKAYPFEDQDFWGDLPIRASRQPALMRLYRRLLGVEPMPGGAGEEGWMYAISSRVVEWVERPR